MDSKSQLKRKSWTVVVFEVLEDQEDMACWLMHQCGSIGAQTLPSEKPLKVTVEATFDTPEMSSDKLRDIEAVMEEYGLASTLPSFRYRSVDEEDWLSKWKEGFEPFPIGDKLLICPPWDYAKLSEDKRADRHVLILEPGMAFGTGLHATTKYCLRALETIPAPHMVLDVGTGSGILAIACKYLYPSAAVVAIDPDDVAIDVAIKNLELNKMRSEIEMICGTTSAVLQSEPARRFDLLLSNLTCEDIVSLLPDYEKLLRPDGVVICAGILEEKYFKLSAAMSELGWKVKSSEPDGMWIGTTIQRE